jgi:di/tricarboxylate transporter
MPPAQKPPVQKRPVQKSPILKSQILRHGIIAFGSALWIAGLWAQFDSVSATATYVVISLLMLLAVVATSGRPINRASSD